MGRILTDIASAPEQSEVWFKNGKPTEQAFKFFSELSGLHAILIQGVFNFDRFEDLADVESKIKNPSDGDTVIFNSQGLGTYNKVSGAWLLSADDTTPIT